MTLTAEKYAEAGVETFNPRIRIKNSLQEEYVKKAYEGLLKLVEAFEDRDKTAQFLLPEFKERDREENIPSFRIQVTFLKVLLDDGSVNQADMFVLLRTEYAEIFSKEGTLFDEAWLINMWNRWDINIAMVSTFQEDDTQQEVAETSKRKSPLRKMLARLYRN